MIWIYLLIALFIYASLFFYRINSRKKFNKWRLKNKSKFVKDVRENWNEIKIKTENCTVIKFDTKVNVNSPTYSMTNENETFYDWMNRDPKRIDLRDVSRCKVICKQKDKGKLTNEFVTTIDMDITIVEFKLKIRDHVSVYVPKDFEKENYFIDLEFLNDDIDASKFA